jgi:pimeloyl-ACP methyl ester carboxylesterase
MYAVNYRSTMVDGIRIAYREAGDSKAPSLLLLHGFPSAGHMFRDLIPLLSERFYLIAPDMPGFGQSDMPSPTTFKYSFDNLAKTIDGFLEAIHLQSYSMYVFDYGAPVGFRLALKRPKSIKFIISQNGNAYEEGLSARWSSLRSYWASPTVEYRESLRSAFSVEAIRSQYLQGVPDERFVSPDGSCLDSYYLTRPGAQEPQLDLFTDFGSNVALYPAFQEYFRTHNPPLLAVWGKNDPCFVPAGAEAFRRDLSDVEVRFLDTGHFALETHSKEIADAIREFFDAEIRV